MNLVHLNCLALCCWNRKKFNWWPTWTTSWIAPEPLFPWIYFLWKQSIYINIHLSNVVSNFTLLSRNAQWSKLGALQSLIKASMFCQQFIIHDINSCMLCQIVMGRFVQILSSFIYKLYVVNVENCECC